MRSMKQIPVTMNSRSKPLRIQIERSGIKWDKLTAIAAILIAASSFLVSYFSFKFMISARKLDQEYHQLSVMPILFSYDSAKYKGMANDDFRGLVIQNKGIGPAQIVTVKYFCNGVEIVGDTKTAAVSFLNEVQKLTKNNMGPSVHFLYPGTFLPIGYDQPVFGFRDNSDVWDNLLRSEKKCGIRIKYQSIYKEEFIFNWGQVPMAEIAK